MKNPVLFIIAAVIFAAVILQPLFSFAQDTSNSYMADKPGQVYYPGDVVHVVVEAPIDTDNVTAIMPDGQELIMVYDRRNKIWHNYWQVPMYFKRGTYVAKLTATDVEGKTFKGETSSIVVAEPTMPVVMQFASSPEAPAIPATPAPIVQKPVAPPAVAPAPTHPAVKQAVVTVKPKAKPVKTVKKRAKSRVKPTAAPKEDINILRMRYITSARNYLSKQDYENAKAQLVALLKIDPENTEVKLMLDRISAVIKAKGIK